MGSVITLFAPISYKNSADADVTNTASNIGDLLLTDYTSRTDNMVFDSDTLSKLYAALTPVGTDGTYENMAAQANATDTRVTGATLHYGITSQKMRDYNGGNNISVTLGGYEWIAVALTVTDDADKDPVLTLLLKDSTVMSSQFSTWGATTSSSDWSGDYPAATYSTSYLRANLLNGYRADGTTKIQYSQDKNTLTDFTPISSHPFEIFIRDKAVGSLTKYLTKPNDIQFQRTEENYYVVNNLAQGWMDMANDSLSTTIPADRFNSNGGSPHSAQSKPLYNDWGDDYLWLPSVTEMGYDVPSANPDWAKSGGIWQTGNDGVDTLRRSQNQYWLRSASLSYSNANYTLTANGVYSGVNDRSSVAVRPALHLNLKEAQDASNAFTAPPATMSSTYDGNVVDLTGESWFRKDLTNYVTVEYRNSTDTANAVLKDAGTYKVKFTIKDPSKHVWLTGDRSDPVRIITYTISKKEIDFPKFEVDAKPYDGGAEVRFPLYEFDDTLIKVSADGVDGVSYNSNRQEAIASKVGAYQLKVSLNDSKNYAWKSQEKLEFKVEPATVKVKLLDIDGSITLSGVLGDKKPIKVEVDTVYLPHENHTVPLIITATKSGSRTRDISAILNITHAGGILDHILDLDELSTSGEYVLGVKTGYATGEDENYKIELDEDGATNITVEEEGSSTSLRWYLHESGTTQLKYKDAELGQYSIVYTDTLMYKK
ncbi:MAG: hypothetical protein K2L37_05740, partial [Lactobacillus sp.]|nr:hypothetical protein [Lactobacillus sp.]